MLDRGYAIVVHGKTGKVPTQATSVATGEPIRARLADGEIDADVTAIRNRHD